VAIELSKGLQGLPTVGFAGQQATDHLLAASRLSIET
jgi:hypothetical protein